MLLINLNRELPGRSSTEQEKNQVMEMSVPASRWMLLGHPAIAHSFVRVALSLVIGSAAVLWLDKDATSATARNEAATPVTVEALSPRLAAPARLPNTTTVPDLPNYRDDDDVLDKYPQYLEFVLAIGKRSSLKVAAELEKKYQALRKRDPRGAANFLRGLQIEIEHKIQLMGIPLRRARASNPEVRRWVTRYLPEWLTEADEYLFRAIARRELE